MQIDDIVTFWRGQQEIDGQGRWMHRLDRKALEAGPHTFNLDHPVSPYIGDVLAAPVIILNANAGYKANLTPTEFPNATSIKAYLARVDDPSHGDWAFVSRYYDQTNYGHLVANRKAVVINACAYRSPRISDKNEADNRAMIRRLPSAVFMRKWLLEAVLPLAANEERLIVAHRYGQWRLPSGLKTAPGVVVDPAPVSARITSVPFARMMSFLEGC
jgi:hypothetical protein